MAVSDFQAVVAVGVNLRERPASARVKAVNIQCISNIKQVTLGINLFALDHGDRMPFQTETDGVTPRPKSAVEYYPLALDARSSWADDYQSRPELAFHLKPFLANDRTLVSQGVSKSLVMICPALVRSSDYISNAPDRGRGDPDDNRGTYRLRRYRDGSALWTCTSPKLGTIRNPSSNGAFADLDKKFPGAGPRGNGIGATAVQQLPAEPAHESTRNYGFFDGHVSAVRAGDANDEAHYNETVAGNTTPYGWLTFTR